MNMIRCNKCDWHGEEEDLMNFVDDEGPEQGCPICKTDHFLMDLDEPTSEDWEKMARQNGWQVRDQDPDEDCPVPDSPVLFHEEQNRVWPHPDWEGAARDLGLMGGHL